MEASTMSLRSLVRFGPVVSAMALVACSGGGSSAPKAAKKDGPVVAKVGDDVITADDVKAKLGEQSPFLQARYKDLQHKKEFVQNLVRFEVLSQEAYRRGLDKQPEVQATLKKVLVQELIKQEFDEKKATYAEAELKAYYDKHIDDFVKPERVRAQHLFLAAPASDKAARAAARAKAQKFLADLKANEGKGNERNPGLFADIARQNSNDAASQATGGDMRYLSQEEMSKQYSKEFATAVFGLKDASDLTGLVEDEQGVHLARLTTRQAAVNRPFDDAQVKETIKGRLFREQRTKSFDEYVEKLKKDAGVNIDEKVLEAVEVPGGATPPPTGAPGGAPPVAGTKSP
jgi:peptidyl-prolyl cis-trans isomerase C